MNIDFDGSTKLSKIISLKFKENSVAFLLYPNPAKNSLKVQIPINRKGLTMKIYNLQGQLQWQQTFSNPSPIIQISLNNMASGLYHLVIEENNKRTETLQFIKQ